MITASQPRRLGIVTSASTGPDTVLAYEADERDSAMRTGWSVIVTGLARLVDEPS